MFTQKYSADCQEYKEEDHRYCQPHLNNIGCAEYAINALFNSNFMIFMKVESEPEEASGHTVP